MTVRDLGGCISQRQLSSTFQQPQRLLELRPVPVLLCWMHRSTSPSFSMPLLLSTDDVPAMAQDENIAKLEHTSATPDVITQTQRHYNPKEDVVGRAEFMPERQFKVTSMTDAMYPSAQEGAPPPIECEDYKSTRSWSSFSCMDSELL